MEDKTMRLVIESNDKGETCDIIIENVSPTSAIYMATKLVTAVAKQFSKLEAHTPLLVNAMMLEQFMTNVRMLRLRLSLTNRLSPQHIYRRYAYE